MSAEGLWNATGVMWQLFTPIMYFFCYQWPYRLRHGGASAKGNPVCKCLTVWINSWEFGRFRFDFWISWFFFLNACFNCSHENYYPEVKGEEFGMALSAEKAKTPKCILQTTKPQALLFFFFSGLAITPFPQIIVLVVAGGCCNWWLYLSAMVEEWQIKMDKFPPVWTYSLSLELLMDQALANGG